MSHLNIAFDRYASIQSIGTVMHYILVISARLKRYVNEKAILTILNDISSFILL